MKYLYLGFLLIFSFFSYSQDTLVFDAYFDSDEHILRPEQIKSLDSILKKLEGDLTDFTFEIQGHTDSIGNWAYNLQLSDKRCQSLGKEVAKLGVNNSQIKIKANSFGSPIDINSTATGRARNRRAQLTIIYSPEKPNWKLIEQSYKINPNVDNTIITINGCTIKIPANATIGTEGMEDVEYRITEYNNPAEFIAAGIPMSFKQQSGFYLYHSEELFNIYALKGKDTLRLNKYNNISIHCKNVDTSSAVKFYKFNSKQKNWVENKIEIRKAVERKENKQAELKIKTDTAKKSAGLPLTLTDTSHVDTVKKPVNVPRIKTDSTGTSEADKEDKVEPEKKEEKVEEKPDEKNEDPIEEKSNYRVETKNKNGNLDTVKRWLKTPPIEIDTVRARKLRVVKIDTVNRSSGGGGGDDRKRGKSCMEYANMIIEMGLRHTLENFNPYLDTNEAFPRINYPDFYKRYKYAGIKPVDTSNAASKNNTLFYALKLSRKKKFLQQKYKVRFKHLKKNNKFFKDFADYKWTYEPKKNSTDIKIVAKKKFSDYRIDYNKETNSVELELKSNNSFYSVVLKPKIKKSKREIFSRKIARFKDSLIKAEKLFYENQKRDSILFKNVIKDAFNRNYFKLFDWWLYSKCAMEYHERELGYREWINYFNTNRERIRTRYLRFQANPHQLYDSCCALAPKQFIPHRGGGDGDPLYLILNFGLYNFDKIIPLENVISLNGYNFVSEKGNKIDVDYGFLILNGINGMVDFGTSGASFLVNGFENRLIIFTKNRRCYKYTCDLFNGNFSEKKTIVFKNINKKILTKKGFEKEMNIK